MNNIRSSVCKLSVFKCTVFTHHNNSKHFTNLIIINIKLDFRIQKFP